jgi:twinkle protein
MDYRREGPTDIGGILDVASAAVMRMGCRVLVIDPYNYIDVGRNLRETDAISQMLTQVQLWAKEHDAHVFFVAHPTKISPDRRAERKTIVTGHDIAGSAAWFAKADIGLSAWRHPRDEEPPEAHVWKVRWSWLGRNGFTPLSFDKVTGRWRDYDYEDDYDWDF